MNEAAMVALPFDLESSWLFWISAASFVLGVGVGVKFKVPMLMALSFVTFAVGLVAAIATFDEVMCFLVVLILPTAALQIGYLLSALVAGIRRSDVCL
ncbi:MAG: hypothetical protein ACK5JT_03500 [Hyphomicrobiaceae bacterium]